MKKEEVLNNLISFNTVNDYDNSKMINYLENTLKNLGFKTEYKTKCLIMSIGNEPVLTFLGHTDVVSVSPKWDYNPFKLTITKDKYIGRGVCDMKGGIAAFILALQEINLAKLTRGIRVCFTYDEEINFNGIKEVIKQNIDLGKYLIIGEPTDNYPCIASQGLIEYELEFKGKKLHSSVAKLNDNSNTLAVKFLNEVIKLDNKFNKEKSSLFNNTSNTINIGLINGGSEMNSSADYTKVWLSFRINEKKEDFVYIKNYMQKLIKKYNINYQIINEIKPFYNPNQMINGLEKIINKERKAFFAVCEASFIDNNNVIILGPGPITAHENNEYILKSSFDETIKIYKKIIERICK